MHGPVEDAFGDRQVEDDRGDGSGETGEQGNAQPLAGAEWRPGG